MNIIRKLRILNPFTNVFKRAELLRDEVGFIGEKVQVFHKVSLGSEPFLISIGDYSKITYGVKFITHDGGCYVLRNMFDDSKDISIYGSITVGKNCFIGCRSTILPNVKIGDNTIIGACSLVCSDIPSNVVAAGNPCKVICTLDEYREKHKDDFLYMVSLPSDKKKTYLKKYFNIDE